MRGFKALINHGKVDFRRRPREEEDVRSRATEAWPAFMHANYSSDMNNDWLYCCGGGCSFVSVQILCVGAQSFTQW
jgi:hypothetical protein